MPVSVASGPAERPRGDPRRPGAHQVSLPSRLLPSTREKLDTPSVTELRAAERATDRLAEAVGLLNENFALYDADDRLVMCNRKHREINRAVTETLRPGVPYEDFIRAGVLRGLFPAAVGREEEWIAERMARHLERTIGFAVARQNGVWVMVTEERMPDGGTVLIGVDITDRKLAEQSLQDSERRHRDFAADVAHELRTPLAVLRSNLDVLDDAETAASLRQDVDAMARMVEQLLTFTRLESLVVDDTAETDLQDLCTQIAARLAPLALKEQRSIEVTGAAGPVVVAGEAGSLEQAVRNLVENAIKYSARGTTVTLRVDESPPRASVIDRGRGVPAKLRESVFERFLRADRRGGGAGLGLAIVRRIVDAHGATIEVAENPDGGGAVFTITFPA